MSYTLEMGILRVVNMEEKMEDEFKFERSATFFRDQVRLVLPKEMVGYLELEEGDTVYIMPEKGKHGKYAAIWKCRKGE